MPFIPETGRRISEWVQGQLVYVEIPRLARVYSKTLSQRIELGKGA